jgi:hemoglobin
MLGPARRAVAWIVPTCTLAAALSMPACGPSKPPVEPEPTEAEPPPPPPTPPPTPPAPSLYERLGKRDALEGIVDDLMGNVLADKRINKLFDKARKDKDRAKQLHARLVAELCVVAGGPDCNYDGKPMKDAHQGMAIGEGQWSAFVEDLTIALKTHSVDEGLIKELIGKLDAQTKADIVAPKGK